MNTDVRVARVSRVIASSIVMSLILISSLYILAAPVFSASSTSTTLPVQDWEATVIVDYQFGTQGGVYGTAHWLGSLHLTVTSVGSGASEISGEASGGGTFNATMTCAPNTCTTCANDVGGLPGVMGGGGFQFSNGTIRFGLGFNYTGINPQTFYPEVVCSFPNGQQGPYGMVYPYFSIAFNWLGNSALQTGLIESYTLTQQTSQQYLKTTVTISFGSHGFPTGGTLVSLSGPVLLNTSSTNQVTAQDGASFVPGDTVDTGSSGYAAVLFSDGSSVQIGPGTSVDWTGGGSFSLSCDCGNGTSSFWNFLTPFLSAYAEWRNSGTCFQINGCGLPAVAAVRGAQFSIETTASGSMTVRDFEGVIQVVDPTTGASVLLNSTQEVTIIANGGNSQQAVSQAVTTFDPASVSQWWTDPSQLSSSSTTSTSGASSISTSVASSSPVSSAASSSSSVSTSIPTSSATSTTSSSSTQTTTTPPGPIPEFPLQYLMVSVFTALVVVSYIILRKQPSRSPR